LCVSILCAKVLDATSEEEFQVLATGDEFMNVFFIMWRYKYAEG
jgi:hypothetical protein